MGKAKVDSELESEKNVGICQWCGHFNLAEVEECEHCGKSLKRREVISPTEGI